MHRRIYQISEQYNFFRASLWQLFCNQVVCCRFCYSRQNEVSTREICREILFVVSVPDDWLRRIYSRIRGGHGLGQHIPEDGKSLKINEIKFNIKH